MITAEDPGESRPAILRETHHGIHGLFDEEARVSLARKILQGIGSECIRRITEKGVKTRVAKAVADGRLSTEHAGPSWQKHL